MTVGGTVVAVLTVECVVDVMVGVVVLVLVEVDVPVEVYSNVVVPVTPLESVAVMTYAPVTHNGVPPAEVE